MLLVAATEFSRHIRRLTPFTHEIFSCFVCSIYVHDGVTQVVGRFDGDGAHGDGGAPNAFGTALFAANLALVVVVLALLLHGAPRWALLPAGQQGQSEALVAPQWTISGSWRPHLKAQGYPPLGRRCSAPQNTAGGDGSSATRRPSRHFHCV